ncbi:Ig-like domain-containing protein [Comamonas sp. J-3]|uniref:Ig-like domain-containing protein n=1 Tax=Comamonas trifloxystrobinivorans TaxID=3350256 RepID=UPI00372BBFD2
MSDPNTPLTVRGKLNDTDSSQGNTTTPYTRANGVFIFTSQYSNGEAYKTIGPDKTSVPPNKVEYIDYKTFCDFGPKSSNLQLTGSHSWSANIGEEYDQEGIAIQFYDTTTKANFGPALTGAAVGLTNGDISKVKPQDPAAATMPAAFLSGHTYEMRIKDAKGNLPRTFAITDPRMYHSFTVPLAMSAVALNSGETSVTGNATAGATLTVTDAAGATVGTAVAQDNGTFSVAFTRALVPDEVLTVTATDPSNAPQTATVKAAPAPVVTPPVVTPPVTPPVVTPPVTPPVVTPPVTPPVVTPPVTPPVVTPPVTPPVVTPPVITPPVVTPPVVTPPVVTPPVVTPPVVTPPAANGAVPVPVDAPWALFLTVATIAGLARRYRRKE